MLDGGYRLHTVPAPIPQDPPQGYVSAQGFSLHANVQCGPRQRSTLERLCGHITRPALGHERLTRTPKGDVMLELTHVIMTPLEFLQRLTVDFFLDMETAVG